jgi:acetyl esterase/lipase
VPAYVAGEFDRRGWNPVALLNRLDRLTPARDRARRVADGLCYGPHERQRLDIWLPADKRRPGGSLPVVVFFYGGGWHSGARQDYGFAGAAFAEQGFVAVVPDYRLVPTVRYPTFLWDAALAVRWVRKHIAEYGGDPNHIVLAGHSAGAYISAMLAIDRRWFDGVGIPQGTIKAGVLLSGPYDFAPFRERRGRSAFGHWPDPAETQPVNHCHPEVPPLLLLHGSSDRIVFAKNSRNLAAKLQSVGAPVKLKIYAGANHADPMVAFSRTFRARLPVLADSVAFLRSALTPPT